MGAERLRGVGKGPDFRLMVVAVVVVVVVVAWPVERSGAAPKNRVERCARSRKGARFLVDGRVGGRGGGRGAAG